MASTKATGTIISSNTPNYQFQGNEVLEVSAFNGRLMDAPSIELGNQKIVLESGQSFPIKFQFPYDASRRGEGLGGLLLSAKINDANGELLFCSLENPQYYEDMEIDVQKYKPYKPYDFL